MNTGTLLLLGTLAAVAIDGARETAHSLVMSAHRAEGNLHEVEREKLRYQRSLACP